MKTKLFFGLALLVALSTACEPEREKEITRPNLQPLTARDWSDLATADTQIEVFDQLRPNGSLAYGLQQLTILNPDESRQGYSSKAEIADFYKAYQEEPHTKVAARDQDSYRQGLDGCQGETCQESVRREINRLQKIARQNCLSMVASFNCCQGDYSQEVMVYLTPGVHCEREQLSQKRIQQASITH
jgi:hypothetical protein